MRPSPLLIGVSLGGLHAVAQTIGAPIFYGCFKNFGSLILTNTDKFLSTGRCQDFCVKYPIKAGQLGSSVQGMSMGTKCYCGNRFPNNAYKVSNKKCSVNCPGYPDNTCGDRFGHYISMYSAGLEDPENIEQDPKPTQTSSAVPTPTSVSKAPQSTGDRSATSTDSSISDSSGTSSSVSKAGVAAGCVVGILAAVSIALGVWLFLRRRRRQQIEEEYRKSAAVRGFVQKPSSDHRLDPGMVQKRDSVGSIADNQDYSRKILKVTNPDG